MVSKYTDGGFIVISTAAKKYKSTPREPYERCSLFFPVRELRFLRYRQNKEQKPLKTVEIGRENKKQDHDDR